MHEPFFLRGTLLYSSSPDTIEILDDGWLLCRNGKAAGVFRQKAERFNTVIDPEQIAQVALSYQE